MAEILISLTIIGVIAAITLPALIGNINERVWDTQRRALYSRISQAIPMIPSLNGYGEYEGIWNNNSVTVIKDTAAHAFVTNGLANVLKINNICTLDEGFNKCGIVSTFTNYGNSKVTMPRRLSELNSLFTKSPDAGSYQQPFNNPQKDVDTQAVAFETANGESILAFYNPRCRFGKDRAEASHEALEWIQDNGYTTMINDFGLHFQTLMCVNFIYDLNGNKGPNKIYKDMGFISVFYPTDSEVVAPVFARNNAKNPNNSSSVVLPNTLTARACHNQNKNSRVPTAEELMSMLIHAYLVFPLTGETTLRGYAYWSSTLLTPDYAYAGYGTGDVGPTKRTATQTDISKAKFAVRCVKK